MTEETHDWVGPVLTKGPLAEAVLAAIGALNPSVRILDRGAYVRVLVPHRCVVTRQAIEERAGRPVRMPGELEAIMSSFKGRLRVSEDEVSWEFGKQ